TRSPPRARGRRGPGGERRRGRAPASRRSPRRTRPTPTARPSFYPGTLGGFPRPPAKNSARQSRAPFTRTFYPGTLGGFPRPPAKNSARQSRAPFTRTFYPGTLGGFPRPPAKNSARQSRAPFTRSHSHFLCGALGGG